jgi:integrase
MAGRRGFGHVRKLPSGRWQASYLGPDGRRYTARKPDGGPLTFDAKDDADGWLALRRSEILRNAWLPDNAPKPRAAVAPDLRAYSETFLATRVTRNGLPLSPSTQLLYRNTLDNQILPGLGTEPIDQITPVMVRTWHAGLDTGPRQRAAAYSLLRTILATAVADDMLPSNPCRVRGAGQSQRARQIKPATIAELEAIASEVPARYKVMVLLAAWCAMRFGELSELRRLDVDVKNAVIHVRRGVVRGGSGRLVKDPKSEAGKRDVHVPPHLMPAVKAHLRDHVQAGSNALVFPAASGRHMAPSSLYAVYHPARKKAGRPDLAFHDLRHTGAYLAAATGATLAELMARLGHSTVSAAMRYQHAAADRDKAIAEALSKLAGDATVTPITRAKSARKRKEATS